MDPLPALPNHPRRQGDRLAVLALLALAALAIGPLLLDPPPVTWSTAAPWRGLIGKLVVVLGMGLSVLSFGARSVSDGWPDPSLTLRAPKEAGRPCRIVLLLALLAGLMTACHWLMVDQQPVRMEWQSRYYLDILNHRADAPHQYRPLPYGFTRTLELLTGDWRFSCVAYRWFFTWWFLWAAYRLARRFHPPARALLALLAVPVLYPLSVAYYFGQLTDPLSHALFVLAMIYIVEDRWLPLLLAVALGVLAKETAILLVPAYLAVWWRQGLAALARTFVLGAAGTAAFLAARVPLGWKPGNADLNGLDGLMIGTNLGIGEPVAFTGVPLGMNYLHPLLFVGTFLPLIVWHWRRLDTRLQALFLTLTPLLLLSNLCFGWLYESRNYLPLVPLLATMAVPVYSAAGGSANRR